MPKVKKPSRRMIHRWMKMRVLQKRIAPWTPTVRDCSDMWGTSISTTHYTLQTLVECGFVRQRPGSGNYWAESVI